MSGSSEALFTFTTRPKCPRCGRRDSVKHIAYGYLVEPPGPHEVAGGCVLDAESPEWRCIRCRQSFGRYSDPEQPFVQ